MPSTEGWSESNIAGSVMTDVQQMQNSLWRCFKWNTNISNYVMHYMYKYD